MQDITNGCEPRRALPWAQSFLAARFLLYCTEAKQARRLEMVRANCDEWCMCMRQAPDADESLLQLADLEYNLVRSGF